MSLVRARPTLLVLLCVVGAFGALGCQRPAVVDRGGPVVAPDYTGPVVGALEEPDATPVEPAPAAEPASSEPPPTWEWALSVVPALAEHSEVDPGGDALARFVGWFDEGGTPRVHFLYDGACHAIEGTMSGEGFHGSWREEITTEGDERRVSRTSFDITRSGITESGPGGIIYRRNAKGRWEEAGGFGIGCFAVLVDRWMSAADDGSVTFGGYEYRLEPVCDRTESVTQTCIGGGERRCERCAGVWLRPVADRMGFGKGAIGVGHGSPTPVDCTQPCPVDEWTPRLPRLAAALAGRRFYGVIGSEGPVVFRTAKGCARELRRRKAAGAAGEPQ